MILELKDICKDYIQGKMVIPVLKHIDFQMEQGEYVAIMGPSGSGKTTLMNIVGCLDQATSGQLFLDGQDISKCTENEMSDLRLKKIGFVFQNFQLLSRQTALENVELPLTYAGVAKKERRERALQALTRVGLEDRVNFQPNQLSDRSFFDVYVYPAFIQALCRFRNRVHIKQRELVHAILIKCARMDLIFKCSNNPLHEITFIPEHNTAFQALPHCFIVCNFRSHIYIFKICKQIHLTIF